MHYSVRSYVPTLNTAFSFGLHRGQDGESERKSYQTHFTTMKQAIGEMTEGTELVSLSKRIPLCDGVNKDL